MRKSNKVVIHLENIHKAYIMGKEAVPALSVRRCPGQKLKIQHREK